MCGIAAILWREAHPVAITEQQLAAMRDALRHRGPDDAGLYISANGRIGLANTRLAIRDLSAAGHMPMQSPDGSLAITYNGELYNAAALRNELQSMGYSFRSSGDTEVVLAGYRYWGEDVVRRLRGIFAFAIADDARLFCARDPLGVKPLYYAVLPNAAVIASELRAFTASGAIERRIDAHALSAYLQLGSVPAPMTMLAGVRALEPGCTLVVQYDARATVRRYYDFPQADRSAGTIDVDGAVMDAVTSQLVADVPVGALLSGGLDSSALVALAAKRQPDLNTLTIGFEESAVDESANARAVARRLGTVHHEHRVTAADFFAAVPRIIGALDQPSIDGFNTWFISQAAAETGLKVLLSGLGGDELFGGYPTFRGVPAITRLLPRAAPLVAAAAKLGRADRWKKLAAVARHPTSRESAYLVYRALYTAEETLSLTRTAMPFDAVQHIHERVEQVEDARDWVSRAELRMYMANQLLRDTDAMSMAHSVEIRVPLLDTDLVDRVMTISPAQRFEGEGSKPLLRAAVKHLLPPEVLDRPKRGFTFPIRSWLNAPQARAFLEWKGGLLDDFDQRALADVRTRFDAGRTHWSRVWALVVLNEWNRQLTHG